MHLDDTFEVYEGRGQSQTSSPEVAFIDVPFMSIRVGHQKKFAIEER